jgi:hypothetical protein
MHALDLYFGTGSLSKTSLAVIFGRLAVSQIVRPFAWGTITRNCPELF